MALGLRDGGEGCLLLVSGEIPTLHGIGLMQGISFAFLSVMRQHFLGKQIFRALPINHSSGYCASNKKAPDDVEGLFNTSCNDYAVSAG
jgi:hypothetical protein